LSDEAHFDDYTDNYRQAIRGKKLKCDEKKHIQNVDYWMLTT